MNLEIESWHAFEDSSITSQVMNLQYRSMVLHYSWILSIHIHDYIYTPEE